MTKTLLALALGLSLTATGFAAEAAAAKAETPAAVTEAAAKLGTVEKITKAGDNYVVKYKDAAGKESEIKLDATGAPVKDEKKAEAK
ncbi:MAG TPA: hypothetical protein VEL07_17925 [Planctomycetota bacterium]|nr:hypothetical protein [Planctomycetota bacterium]